MRKLTIVAGLSLLISMAAVAAPDEQNPEAKAYFSYSFGARTAPNRLNYGLRLDHDRFFAPAEQALPPLMQLDFTRRGMRALSVNGVSVLRPAYRVNQDEEEEDIAEDEDEGFFAGIGSWFSNLFGEDDDEAEDPGEDETQAAEGEEIAEGEDYTTEDEEGFDAVDWGLLALGVVGVGYVAMEVMDGQDDPEQGAAAPATGGRPACIPPPIPPQPCSGPSPIPSIPPFTGRSGAGGVEVSARSEHEEWLDSGTGQMGDLYAQ